MKIRPEASYIAADGTEHAFVLRNLTQGKETYVEIGPDDRIIPDPQVIVGGRPSLERSLVPAIVFESFLATSDRHSEDRKAAAYRRLAAFLSITPSFTLQHEVNDGIALQLRIQENSRRIDADPELKAKLTALFGSGKKDKPATLEELAKPHAPTTDEWGMRVVQLLDTLFHSPEVQAQRRANGLEDSLESSGAQVVVRPGAIDRSPRNGASIQQQPVRQLPASRL